MQRYAISEVKFIIVISYPWSTALGHINVTCQPETRSSSFLPLHWASTTCMDCVVFHADSGNGGIITETANWIGVWPLPLQDFVLGLSILSRGTVEEKLRWTFSLYDINGDGIITREEMTDIVTAIYELAGSPTGTISSTGSSSSGGASGMLHSPTHFPHLHLPHHHQQQQQKSNLDEARIKEKVERVFQVSRFPLNINIIFFLWKDAADSSSRALFAQAWGRVGGVEWKWSSPAGTGRVRGPTDGTIRFIMFEEGKYLSICHSGHVQSSLTEEQHRVALKWNY